MVVWGRAGLWLAVLAPLFYATYGAANWLAARRDDVGSIVFGWEHHVPFLPWTILPYWSINLFYGLSLFLNGSRSAVDRLAGRYLTAQIVAVSCFILFPLTATFERPSTEGLPGFLFAVLGGFDKPFNQAPSLHIALLVIIWDHLRLRIPAPALWVWHAWCMVIGVSVLTTWQHHFVDIPTGALLGVFALWLFPSEGPLPIAGMRLAGDRRARRLSGWYGLGALACLAVSMTGAFFAPAWLALIWPAVALSIVAFGYATLRPEIFQKRRDGGVSWPSKVLLAPYRLGARINVFAWTLRLAADVPLGGGVHLGRFPTAEEANRFAAVVDLTAELARPSGVRAAWTCLPALDLLAPPKPTLVAAAAAVEKARRTGPVLICCALGFQRSALAAVQWLVAGGIAADEAQARAILEGTGRPVHLGRETQARP